MKPLLLGVSGITFAAWSAIEASVLLAAQGSVSPTTGVPVTIVIQLSFLVASAVILVKFGMLLSDWKSALDMAITFGEQVVTIEKRQAKGETRLALHDAALAQHELLLQEHAARLGLGPEPFKRLYDDEAAG